MKFEHINNDKTKLLIFFCGFYTDKNCFIEFDNGKSDILFVYDYSDLDFSDLEYFDYTPYTEINLIAYSYGVFAANIAYNYLPCLNYSVAISGTIYPIDEVYGIKPKIYDIMLNSFNMDVINNFKMKMELNSGGKIKESNRTLENLYDELISIKNYVLNNEIEQNLDFDKVIITTKDKIVSYGAQKNFWINHKYIQEVNTGHFPFFEFESFDEILQG